MKTNLIFGLAGALVFTLIGQSFSQSEGDKPTDECQLDCPEGSLCMTRGDGNGPQCECFASSTFSNGSHCGIVMCGFADYTKIITRPNHGRVVSCDSVLCLLKCDDGFVFEDSNSSPYQYYSCDLSTEQWNTTNTNCVESPSPPTTTTYVYHWSDNCELDCYDGASCMTRDDGDGPKCFCYSSSTIYNGSHCDNVMCGYVDYTNIITRPNHGIVVSCIEDQCLLKCDDGFVFENSQSARLQYFTCDYMTLQWNFTNTNCVANPNNDCGCNPIPTNCWVINQSPCTYTKRGQTCGIGTLTEYRRCYDYELQVYYEDTVQRNCCVEKCLTGTGDVPECTCADVWPECDNVSYSSPEY